MPLQHAADGGENLDLSGHVQRRGRFVQDQKFRPACHRHCNHGALQLPAGDLVRVTFSEASGRGKIQLFEELGGVAMGGGPAGGLVEHHGFGDLVTQAPGGIERSRCALSDVGNACAADCAQCGRRQRREILSVENDASTRYCATWADIAQAGQADRRLACAGLADQAQDFPAIQCKTDAVVFSQPGEFTLHAGFQYALKHMRDIWPKRLTCGTKESGTSALANERSSLHQINKSRSGIGAGPHQFRQHRANRRTSADRLQIIGRETALALERIVGSRRTNERSNKHKPIRNTGNLRHEFRNAESRKFGLNRIELTTNLHWSFGLGINGIQMRRTTIKMNINDRLQRSTIQRSCFCSQQICQSPATKAKRPDLQHSPTHNTVAVFSWTPIEIQHDARSSGYSFSEALVAGV